MRLLERDLASRYATGRAGWRCARGVRGCVAAGPRRAGAPPGGALSGKRLPHEPRAHKVHRMRPYRLPGAV